MQLLMKSIIFCVLLYEGAGRRYCIMLQGICVCLQPILSLNSQLTANMIATLVMVDYAIL